MLNTYNIRISGVLSSFGISFRIVFLMYFYLLKNSISSSIFNLDAKKTENWTT